MAMNRRGLLALGCTTALARPALAQASRARTLRVVPQADLANLDPIWTTAAVTLNHGYAIFDTLYALDDKLQPRPQMAAGHDVSEDRRVWTIRLRPGLKFHDGEPVRSRDCIASLLRWGKRDAYGQMLARVTEKWEAPDDLTIRLTLTKPFPLLLDALAKRANFPPFIMPQRLAVTDASIQIAEMVGSGPYRFLKDEWSIGNRAAYARYDGYLPREEAASFMAGGKRANFDRVEWHTVPDASTASAALVRGEVDWLEQTMPDLNATFARSRDVRLEQIDNHGLTSFLRFNCQAAPFNNGRLRRAILGAINQADYMQAVTGDAIRWQRCASLFPCGMPFSRELGGNLLNTPRDLAKVREEIRAAGYAGERVVIMNPTDFPSIAPLGFVTADVLTKIGMNVDLQSMDWGTLVQRRASKAPVAAGGWSIFHSWAGATTMMNPGLNDYVRGLGAGGYFGWHENAAIEGLVERWINAASDDERQQLVDAIQTEAWAAPPTIMLGQYYPTTALRSDLSGRLPTSMPLPWNIRRA
ncbi:ABC transporter substrate-binding protein [Roseomonas sp. 18066]|uniref:ABC transporter substrate-binding protein n=1 Tax=Roseomonas sp. 18066 TaxID=2681412 RepID=UPI001356DBAA|nr:ABC transporter substrate-binding protein [Roseomonas sp. 18066]